MKLAIVGSRTFTDFNLLEKSIKAHYDISQITHIVSGGASGADTLSKEFADKYQIECIVFIPNWKKYGPSAGFKRNILIVEECDQLIAFWDNQSSGTRHSIYTAEKQNKPVKTILYKDQTNEGPFSQYCWSRTSE